MKDRLTSYIENKARNFVDGFVEVTAGGLRNPIDPQAGMNANRADKKEKLARQAMASGRDTHRKGRGPSVTVVSGGLNDVVVVDKGQEYDEIQAATATNSRGGSVNYFAVDRRPVAVINTKAGIRQWVAQHGDHLIVQSLAVGDQSGERGGTSNELLTDPSRVMRIGIVAAQFVGIWDDSDRYEIIDPLGAVLDVAAQGAGLGLGTAISGGVAPVMTAIGDATTAADLGHRIHDLVKGEDKPVSNLVVIEFHPSFATGIDKEKGATSARSLAPCDEKVTDSEGRALVGISVAELADSIEGLLDQV